MRYRQYSHRLHLRTADASHISRTPITNMRVNNFVCVKLTQTCSQLPSRVAKFSRAPDTVWDLRQRLIATIER